MTDTASKPVADADALAIFEARDWARLAVQELHTASKVHPFHSAHSLIAEALAIILHCPIEAARAMTTAFLEGLVHKAAEEIKRTQPLPSALTEQPSNVVKLNGGDNGSAA